MKSDMILFYVSDHDVEVKLSTEIDGISLSIKDGDKESRSSFSVKDIEELERMCSQARNHYARMQNAKKAEASGHVSN